MRHFFLPLAFIAHVAAFDSLASPISMYESTDEQSWFAPPRNLHPSVTALPIPTNRWWGNLISHGKDAEPRVWTNPYSVGMQKSAIGLSYPAARRQFGGASGNGQASRYYLHPLQNDFVLGTTEPLPSPFQVVSWDDLGVTVRAAASTSSSSSNFNSSSLETSLVSGMAFVTMTYRKLTPHVSPSSAVILFVNGRAWRSGTSVTGTKFIVSLNNDQTWVIYTSTAISWTADTSKRMVASAPFNGHVRLALLPTNQDPSALDAFQDCLVLGGHVATAASSYAFHWKTSGICARGLVHFALPHHLDSVERSSTTTVTSAVLPLSSTTRGMMTALVGTTWTLEEPNLLPVGLYPHQRPSAARVRRVNLKAHLAADIASPWVLPNAGSYYFNGKAAHKYANLCLMAADPVVNNDKDLLELCRQKLGTMLTPFIENSWNHKLVYDTVYKGIVSGQGFSTKDLNADFGNTMYNDHHFHYGYWIAAAAITNHVHPSWSKLRELNQMASFLIRDVANANPLDKAFPTFRMFDWYKGHSYSHGVTSMADGKDQESSSEDINFHYAMTMFGATTNKTSIETLGRLMLTLNARAVQTYFLMDSQNRVHPESVRANKVLGIFFDNKVDYATWFSAEKHCIHGIQMIPITPVTAFVRTKRFVQEEWTEILSKLPVIASKDMKNSWASLLYANYATVDPETAMKQLQHVLMDDGLTRSWALYMAASQ